ncbi:MAG: alpha/beta hydrolase-fold protein [Thermoleophilaceae bacterium]
MRLRTAAGLALGVALALPGPALASRLETWTTSSRYVDPSKVRFNGPADRPKALRVNVLLPDGYDGKRRFPVLYLLHGHGDAYDSWADPAHGDVARIAAHLGAIVVMPEGARGWYTNWWNGGRRGAPAWEGYHLDELIPLVEKRLRIRPGRRWHAIAGLSMGGEGAMYYATQRPGYFGTAASFSGVLSIQRDEWPSGFNTQGENYDDVFGDPSAQRFYSTGHNPTALSANLDHTRLFVAVGNGVPGPNPDETSNTFGQVAEIELAQQAKDFVAAAEADGNHPEYRPQQGIHDWPYWRRHLTQAIAWGLFRPVDEHPAAWSFQTVSRSGDMWGLRFRFVAAPNTVETFRLRRGTLTGSGGGRVTIETTDGCRFTATLEFTRRVPSGCTLHLRVRPRSVRAGGLRRFRFRAWVVRDGRRVPVRRARIRVRGKRLRTNRRGLASIKLRFHRAGRYRVRATRHKLVAATTFVRVR